MMAESLNRRLFLRRAASTGAAAVMPASAATVLTGSIGAAATAEVTIASAPADPLLDTIRAYRAGVAAFNALPACDDDEIEEQTEQTYLPHQEALVEWSEPAATAESAREALRLVVEDLIEDSESMFTEPMIAAAIGFLDMLAGKAVQS